MTRERFGLAFAALIAAIGLMALFIELNNSLAHRFEHHHAIAEALYLHFRFFTIMTNWGAAILLVTTIVSAFTHRRLPHAGWFGAALIYLIVVGGTYEALLRHTGMTHDIFFFTDMIMHDIVPTFFLAFWLGFAPKTGLDFRHPVLWLAFPAVYFTLTLTAGAMGEGYPYFFFDAGKYGYVAVTINAMIFLVVFYLLGVGTVFLSKVTPRGLAGRVPLVEDTPCGIALNDDRSPAV